LAVWAFLAKRPLLYRLLIDLGMPVLKMLGGKKGRLAQLPLAAGWTASRDLPAPEGESFMKQWSRRGRD
jgi:L-lactate dehydrogenase complex protein LldF